MRRWFVTAFACCSLLGCGIGSSDTVEEIGPDELAVLDPTSTTSTTVPDTTPVDSTPGSLQATTTTVAAPTSTVPTEEVTLYFVSGSQLVPVDTPVPVPMAERAILDALAAGPPADEFEAGVRTAVPAELVAGTRQVGRRITVDFRGDPLLAVDSTDQRLMVAQIVLTLTKISGIEEVLFTTDGEPLGVYQREGELTEPGEPVTAGDYAALLTP